VSRRGVRAPLRARAAFETGCGAARTRRPRCDAGWVALGGPVAARARRVADWIDAASPAGVALPRLPARLASRRDRAVVVQRCSVPRTALTGEDRERRVGRRAWSDGGSGERLGTGRGDSLPVAVASRTRLAHASPERRGPALRARVQRAAHLDRDAPDDPRPSRPRTWSRSESPSRRRRAESWPRPGRRWPSHRSSTRSRPSRANRDACSASTPPRRLR
jgi:hypothetical protein